MANTSKSRTTRRSSARRSTGSRNTTSRSTRRTSARASARRATAARRTGTTRRSTASRSRRTSAAGKSRSTASRKTSSSSSQSYTSVKQQLDQQINALRQLKSQAEGKGAQGRPSPATISRFANVVNSGGVIRKASTAAIQRTAGRNRQCRTAGAAFKALKSKYGATIKAVSPAKNGGWLIAASSTWKGKPFKFGQ
jgi:hypothetical protein